MTAPTHGEFGIALPQVVGPDVSLESVRRFAVRAEELGYGALWVSELTSAPIVDPVVLLGYAAAATHRVRLGVAVLLTPLRTPVQLARDLASVDLLSQGRLTVGVGLGSNRAIYARYGLSPERRLARYVEGLDLLRRLWAPEPVTFHNEWWQLDQVQGLAPAQRPHPPLWFGARTGPALRRAVELGDGWVGSGSAPPEEFADAMVEVRRHLDDVGRDPSTFTVSKRVYLAVTDDAPATSERLRGWFGANYGKPSLADAVAVVGDAAHCVEHLARLRTDGVDHVLLNPVLDVHEQLEALAEEVIPQLG